MGCLTSRFATQMPRRDEFLDDILAGRPAATTPVRRAKPGFLGLKTRPSTPARPDTSRGADLKPTHIKEPCVTTLALADSPGIWLPYVPNTLESLPTDLHSAPTKPLPPLPTQSNRVHAPTKPLPLLPPSSPPKKPLPTRPLPSPDFELRAAVATIRELRGDARRYAVPHTCEARKEWQREWNEVFVFLRGASVEGRQGV